MQSTDFSGSLFGRISRATTALIVGMLLLNITVRAQQTENVQAARQVRLTSLQQIVKMEKVLKSYIYEAVEVEEAGLKVPLKKTQEFKMPEEFQTKLDKLPALKKAFYELTPGRQRGYLLYFSSAKQPKTREARIEKYAERILDGKGLED